MKSRAYDKETNLFTFVFDNEDGTGTMKVFKHPVKYYDENGDIKDITLKLEQTEDGGYKTADNSIISSFPQKLSDGIGISCENINISMKPVTGNEGYAECDDLRKVSYQTDEYTAYEYQLTYTGYKEDIVVSQYTGQTEYDFILNTNGLELYEESGSYSLRDSEGNISAEIGDIFVFSADNKNNTLGSITYETIKENDEYLLTVHVDEEYLSSEDTIYPVTIDPYIYVNYSQSGGSAINDATICSNYNSTDNEANYLYVGKRTTKGKSRALISFPNLNLSSIYSSSNVQNAYLYLSEATPTQQNEPSMEVECCMFTGSWAPSFVTWNNVQPGINTYSPIASKVISYSNTVSNSNRYKFNVIDAVKRWVDAKDIPNTSGSLTYNVFRPYRGLTLKATDTVEASTTDYYKKFVSYNAGTEQSPSLTIKFTYDITSNLFYTKYDPVKYNTSVQVSFGGQSTDLYRYRTNCYGYAFGLLLNHGVTNEHEFLPGYFTQPNFVFHSSGLTVSQYAELMVSYLSDDADAIADATYYDYSVEDITTTVNNSDTVPQYGSGSRLIALATGKDGNDYGFHFYMQNTDGTWSHKSGLSNVSNLSLTDDNHLLGFILTNENFKGLAKRGAVTNGPLKFLLITKRHAVLPYNSYNSFEVIDRGDYLETASTYSGTINVASHLEYDNDYDTFYLTNTTSKQYRIRATFDPDADPDYELTVEIRNKSGTLIVSESDAISMDFYYSLSGGNQYYIRAYCDDINYSQLASGVPLYYTLSIT